ncbi:hypothetical protein RYX36_030466 [Vicia faba]
MHRTSHTLFWQLTHKESSNNGTIFSAEYISPLRRRNSHHYHRRIFVIMLAQIAMTTSGRSLSPSTPLYAAAEPLSSRIETTPKQPRNTDAATRFEHEPPHKPAQEAGANTPFSPTGTTR